MAKSPAEFAAWLAGDNSIVVLCEQDFAYESAGAPAIGTLYSANRAYVTGASDSPPAVRYAPSLKGAPTLKRSIDRRQLGGRSNPTITDFVHENRDGSLDYLLKVVIDGYESRVYVGDKTWPRADFQLVFVGVAERVVAPNDNEIIVKVRDKRLLLDQEVIGSPVGGSGPDATSYLPLLWGSHFNVEAKAYDTSVGKYSVLSNHAGARVVDVRDKGLSLRDSTGGWTATSANTTVDTGTDTFTKTAHALAVDDVIFFADPIVVGELYTYWAPFAGMSARPYWVKSVPTANTFTLSETKGGATLNVTGSVWSDSGFGFLAVVRQRYFDDLDATGRIQLSGPAVGRVTVDLVADDTYKQAPFAFAKYLIETYGSVSASDIDSAAFTAADAALDAKIALGYTNYSVSDRANLLDVLDALMSSVFGWVGADAIGRITCGVIDLSGMAAATPSRTFTKYDIAEGYLSVENDAVGLGRANVQFDVNHTVQGDGLADLVSADNRRAYAQRYRKTQRSSAPSGTTYAGNKFLYHRTMVEGGLQNAAEMSSFAFGVDGAIALDNYADEIVADRAPHRQFLGAAGRINFYDCALGEVLQVVYPRYGLDAGVSAIVIEVELNLSKNIVGLVWVRQSSPDVVTGRYL